MQAFVWADCRGPRSRDNVQRFIINDTSVSRRISRAPKSYLTAGSIARAQRSAQSMQFTAMLQKRGPN